MNFLDSVSKKRAVIPNFIKIRPVGAELFHVARQTDMTKLTVAFRNVANAPKNAKEKCSQFPAVRTLNNFSSLLSHFALLLRGNTDKLPGEF